MEENDILGTEEAVALDETSVFSTAQGPETKRQIIQWKKTRVFETSGGGGDVKIGRQSRTRRLHFLNSKRVIRYWFFPAKQS